MKKLAKRFRGNEKGFTLIELIIVIAILAIISAIAVPNVLNAVDNARKTTDLANARIIADAAAQVRAKYSQLAGTTYADTDGLDTTNEVAAPAANVATSAYTFPQALCVELNQAVPKPQYKGIASFDEDVFLLTIDDLGTVRVYVADEADDTVANAKMIYPTPTGDFDNK